jgi:hypothetical protein
MAWTSGSKSLDVSLAADLLQLMNVAMVPERRSKKVS